jgi:hypothetical protein
MKISLSLFFSRTLEGEKIRKEIGFKLREEEKQRKMEFFHTWNETENQQYSLTAEASDVAKIIPHLIYWPR